MYAHPLIDTLPINQDMIWRNSSPLNAMTSDSTAPKKALKIIPARINVSTLIFLSAILAKKRTSNNVTNAAQMLMTGKVKEPMNGS